MILLLYGLADEVVAAAAVFSLVETRLCSKLSDGRPDFEEVSPALAMAAYEAEPKLK